MDTETKVCRFCKIEKPIDDFWKNKRLRGGRYHECKKCAYEKHCENLRKRLEIDPLYSSKRQQAWERKGRNRLRKRLRDVYKISLDDYDAMLLDQGHVCAICNLDFDENRDAAVDHDHETGRVRGIVHTRCNAAIAFLKESPSLCRMAAIYLEKHGKV